MVDPLIRPATREDIGELAWLEGLARDLVAEQRGGDLWLERHPAQSPDWVAVGDGRVVVGLIDDALVGYLRLDQVDSVLHVRDVFVHPDAREVGFGDALLDAAVEIGRRGGATRIEAEALPGDRDTKNLYERAGVTAKRITVSSLLADLDRR